MARRLLVIDSDGGAVDFTEVPAPDEHHLQDRLKDHPELLPVDDFGLSGDLLVVGRETTLASGAVDLIGLMSSGDLVLVEFKTGPKNPDFRAALAQLLDYGSDLYGMSLADFNTGVVQRYLTSTWCPPTYKTANDLHELAEVAWEQPDADAEARDARLAQVLESGDFHYVVAAQRFTQAMTATVGYLNDIVRVGRYHLVQLIKLDGAGNTAYSAQAIATPRRRSGPTSASSSSVTNEERLLAALGDDEYRDAMRDILTRCRTLGLSLEWGSKGTSIRLRTPDRTEPISIGWAFPEGTGWSGIRHLGLGYDTASAANTPSVAGVLEQYARHVATIPGGTPASGKGLNATNFEPAAVVRSRDDLLSAIEWLVSRVADAS